jgi:ribosomal protein S18 acetylase RimI-like enzyme
VSDVVIRPARGEAGYSALSLSVEEENPALRLYERVGFERHAHGDGVWTVVLPLA